MNNYLLPCLKEIAKDRLIIMVTHNPDLAEKYSTRIVRLQDGLVVSDSNPYDGSEYEWKETSEESIQEKENKQKECESFIESEKSRKTLYDHASTIEHLIGQIDRAQIIIQQTEKSINDTEKECQKTEEVLKAKIKKLKQVEELKAEKQKQWEEAQEMAKPYDLVKLSNQNIENSQRLTALKELKADFENHHDIQKINQTKEQSPLLPLSLLPTYLDAQESAHTEQQKELLHSKKRTTPYAQDKHHAKF